MGYIRNSVAANYQIYKVMCKSAGEGIQWVLINLEKFVNTAFKISHGSNNLQ